MSDINTKRLGFFLSELGFEGNNSYYNIKEKMVELAQSKVEGMVEFCEAVKSQSDNPDLCKDFMAQAKNDLSFAHMSTEQAHIERANQGFMDEMGLDASQYTADGVVTKNEAVHMMIDAAKLSAEVNVGQQHIRNVESFLSAHGIEGEFSQSEVKDLAKIDAIMELTEQRRADMIKTLDVDVGGPSANLEVPPVN